MPDLTKTRTILKHSHSVERGPVFDAADEDGGRLTVLTLDESVWADMGSPEQITVTIEPGDLLNVELDHHNMPLNEGFAADSTEHLVAALRAMRDLTPDTDSYTRDAVIAQADALVAEFGQQPTGEQT